MRVLLVDRSGRGHAFADVLSRTNEDVFVHYAPGCGAITHPRVISVPHLDLADPGPMVEYARRENVNLVLVTNAAALADGFVDAFRSAGLAVIGPDRAASRLEWSKAYAKELFARYGVPSPEFAVFSDPESARAHVRDVAYQVVVKADGLCGGNGSFVCDGDEEAMAAIDRLMVDRVFAEAGASVVVERRLFGREVSFFLLVDGDGYLMLPMALDYPKSDDGNLGVVSGGMGALCPHPMESESLVSAVETTIVHPLMRLLAQERLAYTGVLYLGCMLVGEELVLLEVNARMGDPEAEVVLPRIETDFLSLCLAINEAGIGRRRLTLNESCFCNVVATQGPTRGAGAESGQDYPGWPFGAFGRHYPISGLEAVDTDRCRVFLGEATVLPGKGLVSDGGRVVHVVGVGAAISEAVESAYDNIGHIHFEGIRYRRDIGRVMPWEE